MKMILWGECTEDQLMELGKSLVKIWGGKREYMNALIIEGLEHKTVEESQEILSRMCTE